MTTVINVPLSADYINKILDDMSALQASEGQYLRGQHITDAERPEVAISVADREMVMFKLRKALEGAEQPKAPGGCAVME